MHSYLYRVRTSKLSDGLSVPPPVRVLERLLVRAGCTRSEAQKLIKDAQATNDGDGEE